MFKNLKLRVGHKKLRKELTSFTREKKVHNFVSARKIAIVFYASSKNTFQQVVDFSDFITKQNLEVTLLAYCPQKEIPQEFQLFETVNLFTKKETNWYGKPLAPFAEEFMATNFDILIDLSTEELFPLKWVVSLSKAKFRVGNLSYPDNPNDLIINIKPNEDLNYLISQIKHYLNLINNRFAQQDDN
ncbi:DUF6913 domain-containing protein [Perlabentimonas gracilis]|uniref:DUF6913 domain-containing protein n=1 Tax=Perlabentimonas gracilis TaxID=2715279 RepID=UPI00140BE964|nr:hypothetical protein [Perlabentimonas gracilis]NHB67430.1 hypothetical protein [Perlabentimonas gracilis]